MHADIWADHLFVSCRDFAEKIPRTAFHGRQAALARHCTRGRVKVGSTGEWKLWSEGCEESKALILFVLKTLTFELTCLIFFFGLHFQNHLQVQFRSWLPLASELQLKYTSNRGHGYCHASQSISSNKLTSENQL
jgi:hypothetical protein